MPGSHHANQFSENRGRWKNRVRTGHRVAAREETVAPMFAKKAMQEKTALSKGEDDLSGPNLGRRTGHNLN